MSETGPVHKSWLLPVLLAITTSAALGFAVLYFLRPNAGELGAIRVVLTDDNGKPANSIHINVAEAPFIQKETVSPGSKPSNIVYYPVPYLVRPNLKLSSAKRKYEVVAETEAGFTWAARIGTEDLREAAPKEGNMLDKLLQDPKALAALLGSLKPGLVFEDFTWEAKGIRAPISALPPKIHVQNGNFYSNLGQQSIVFFEYPFDSPPNVEFSGGNHRDTVIVECTAQNFKWRNEAKDLNRGYVGDVKWTAKGVRK
jgi:hypothetical protein